MTFKSKTISAIDSILISLFTYIPQISRKVWPESLNFLQNCGQLHHHRIGTQPRFSLHLYSLQQSPEEAEEAEEKRITGALIHIEYSSRGANE